VFSDLGVSPPGMSAPQRDRRTHDYRAPSGACEIPISFAIAGKGTMAKRTTHRSTSGKKLYAKRNSRGQFTDIQTFERAHERDLKRKSKSERKK
jgi:hypothetical protein